MRRRDMTEQEFLQLCQKYRKAMLRAALEITHNRDDAEDVWQMAMIKGFRYRHTLRGGQTSFQQWFRRIVRNLAIDLVRARRSLPYGGREQVCAVVSEKNGYGDLVHRDHYPSEVEYIWQVLEQLPESCRHAAVLHFRDELSNEEIAARLGITIPAVKGRLHRARCLLRKALSA